MTYHTYFISFPAKIFILCFITGIILYLAKKAINNKLHPLDFLALSTIALVPALYIISPATTLFLTNILGIKTPFILLFGTLILILYLFILSLIRRINKLEKEIMLLTQKIVIEQANISRSKKITQFTENKTST